MTNGHLTHPEDLLLSGGAPGGILAIELLRKMTKTPSELTIKYDGYPALIFGRNLDGQFGIMDKHMFNKRDGTGRKIFSPRMFVEYDLHRGANRQSLWETVENIWDSLEYQFGNNVGYVWGDLLFSKPLDAQNGIFRFRANPNGMVYEIKEHSSLGKAVANKLAGIVVHQSIPASAVSVDEANPVSSKLKQGDVLILSPNLPIVPKVGNIEPVLTQLKAHCGKLSSITLFNDAPTGFAQFLMGFANYVVKTGDLEKLMEKLHQYATMKAVTYIDMLDQAELSSVLTLWAQLMTVKNILVNQIDKQMVNSPIVAKLDNGKIAHEGYVGFGVKFVNRFGFSKQNFAGNS